MKKTALFLALIMVLVMGAFGSHTAFAADEPVEEEAPAPVPVFSNGDPLAYVQAWGLSGHATPRLASGKTVTDEAGFTDSCPAWYGSMGCFDLTQTPYYRKAMIEAARQAKAMGTINQFSYSRLGYWLQFAK